MSIIQISKIQQRAGDLVDLPQLDEAEFGFASDVNRLFIGKTAGITENVEVLTAYSDIAFSQIDGAEGNLDITNAENGEVLSFDGTNWTNKGGNAGGYINLGDVSNISIQGGPIGYVLSSDGANNLIWTPKGMVTSDISDISKASPARVTLTTAYPYAEGTEVTINGISGSNDFANNLNGNIFYLQAVPGNLSLYDLYTDAGLLSPVNSSGYSGVYSNGGMFIFNTSSSNGSPGGSNTSVQFSTGAGFGGDGYFKYDYLPSVQLLSVPNANITGIITTTNITTGSSGTAGTITGNWSLSSGSKLQSTYADLAEYYAADKAYTPGTVLEFGGEKEVTLAGPESSKVAGVISSDPAYVMNGDLQTEFPAILALIGRVKVKVKGTVSKGDMLVSAGQGYARASILTPKIGTVIGKAIENKFTDEEGMVEVLVGRL